MTCNRASRLLATREDGLTLIEVVVAIFIIGVLATASVGFYITSIKAASTQQRTEVAVTVANNSMEQVTSSVTTTVAATGLSTIYKNRGKTAVDGQWSTAALAAVPGLNQTWEVWDTAAASLTGSGDIPLSGTSTVNGTTYTWNLYIGRCFEPVAGGTCTRQGTATQQTVSGYVAMNRVISYVTWTAGCSSTCSYQATTLINNTADLQWITHA